MVTQAVVRLTASIPRAIADQTDEIAISRKISRSKLIVECLQKMIDERNQQLLIEGYRAMALEHKSFARLSKKASREALPKLNIEA